MVEEPLMKRGLQDDPLIRALGLEGDGTFAPCISELYSYNAAAQVRYCDCCGNFFSSDEPAEGCAMCGAPWAPTMPMLERRDFAQIVEMTPRG